MISRRSILRAALATAATFVSPISVAAAKVVEQDDLCGFARFVIDPGRAPIDLFARGQTFETVEVYCDGAERTVLPL